MAIKAGQRLGAYEVQALVGAGGMGEVYKGRDTRLDRSVAIKVLPEHLADRSDLRDRLEREARAVSALNHPHICTLFDVGTDQGIDFLVMEYLEGETLQTRLERGPLPLQQAIRIATEIADALSAAHRAGITHRDLKPGNVMLTKAGPKLLDFGLSKTQPAAASFDSQSAAPTRGASLTVEGTIVGTLQYLSPEQIQGKEADSRTDIFAFGAMLYEMVTGKKAFQGKSQVSLLAAILEHDPPPMSTLQRITPTALDHVVQRCLAKDPDNRWQSILDVFHELEWIKESGASTLPQATSTQARRPWLWMTTAAVFFVAVVVLVFMRLGQPSSPPRVLRYSIPLPKKGTVEGLYFDFHLSPDGRFIAASGVIEGAAGIFVRELDGSEWRLLPGTGGATNGSGFFWSADSRNIAFSDAGKMKRVKISGGPPEEIPAVQSNGADGSWSKDDMLLISTAHGAPIVRAPAAGGESRPVTIPGNDRNDLYPFFLPDGRQFLYTQQGSMPGIYIASLDDPVGRRLLADESSVTFSSLVSGKSLSHLIFMRDGKLMAQQFDQKALQLLGDAFVLTDRGLWNQIGSVAVSASNDGILMFLAGRSREADSRTAWFDRSGKITMFEVTSGTPAPLSISPDERTASLIRRQPGQTDGDVWLYDLTRSSETRFTSQSRIDPYANVIWSSDGSRIAFSMYTPEASEESNLFTRDITGSGKAELIVKNENRKIATDWSKDGLLIFTQVTPKTGADIYYVPMSRSGTPDDKPVAFLKTEFDESFGQVSPDGHWIAYLSNESGADEVYVRPFPTGSGKWKVSSSSGTQTQQPRWNPNGKELFFLTGSVGVYKIMSSLLSFRVSGGAKTVEVGDPKPLFEARVNGYHPQTSTYFYSVSKDGHRFLINHVDSTTEPVLNIIVNWQQAFSR